MGSQPHQFIVLFDHIIKKRRQKKAINVNRLNEHNKLHSQIEFGQSCENDDGDYDQLVFSTAQG